MRLSSALCTRVIAPVLLLAAAPSLAGTATISGKSVSIGDIHAIGEWDEAPLNQDVTFTVQGNTFTFKSGKAILWHRTGGHLLQGWLKADTPITVKGQGFTAKALTSVSFKKGGAPALHYVERFKLAAPAAADVPGLGATRLDTDSVRFDPAGNIIEGKVLSEHSFLGGKIRSVPTNTFRFLDSEDSYMLSGNRFSGATLKVDMVGWTLDATGVTVVRGKIQQAKVGAKLRVGDRELPVDRAMFVDGKFDHLVTKKISGDDGGFSPGTKLYLNANASGFATSLAAVPAASAGAAATPRASSGTGEGEDARKQIERDYAACRGKDNPRPAAKSRRGRRARPQPGANAKTKTKCDQARAKALAKLGVAKAPETARPVSSNRDVEAAYRKCMKAAKKKRGSPGKKAKAACAMQRDRALAALHATKPGTQPKPAGKAGPDAYKACMAKAKGIKDARRRKTAAGACASLKTKPPTKQPMKATPGKPSGTSKTPPVRGPTRKRRKR